MRRLRLILAAILCFYGFGETLGAVATLMAKLGLLPRDSGLEALGRTLPWPVEIAWLAAVGLVFAAALALVRAQPRALTLFLGSLGVMALAQLYVSLTFGPRPHPSGFDWAMLAALGFVAVGIRVALNPPRRGRVGA